MKIFSLSSPVSIVLADNQRMPGIVRYVLFGGDGEFDSESHPLPTYGVAHPNGEVFQYFASQLKPTPQSLFDEMTFGPMVPPAAI